MLLTNNFSLRSRVRLHTQILAYTVMKFILQGTAAKYGIRAMPTFMFFKNGSKIHEFQVIIDFGLNHDLKGSRPESTTKNGTNVCRSSSTSNYSTSKAPIQTLSQG